MYGILYQVMSLMLIGPKFI